MITFHNFWKERRTWQYNQELVECRKCNLEKTENEDARKILKAIAVIRMMNQPGELLANAEFLYLATGLKKDRCENAIDLLCKGKDHNFQRK